MQLFPEMYENKVHQPWKYKMVEYHWNEIKISRIIRLVALKINQRKKDNIFIYLHYLNHVLLDFTTVSGAGNNLQGRCAIKLISNSDFLQISK